MPSLGMLEFLGILNQLLSTRSIDCHQFFERALIYSKKIRKYNTMLIFSTTPCAASKFTPHLSSKLEIFNRRFSVISMISFINVPSSINPYSHLYLSSSWGKTTPMISLKITNQLLWSLATEALHWVTQSLVLLSFFVLMKCVKIKKLYLIKFLLVAKYLS